MLPNGAACRDQLARINSLLPQGRLRSGGGIGRPRASGSIKPSNRQMRSSDSKGWNLAELLLMCLALESSSATYSPICKLVILQVCIGDPANGTCSRTQAAADIPVPLPSDKPAPVTRFGSHEASAAMEAAYRAAAACGNGAD